MKFGDVVEELKEEVDRSNHSFEYYVAGEHMNSNDLHLVNYGVFGDDYVGPAFKRIFRKGHVLYGSRRTYLKKIAIAEFDGITSNTTFVLKTKSEDNLLQRFLPFIMMSDKFTEHSIQESRGSVNPYIVFSDIAKYEFLLPPIDEQKRIAEVLWAADEDLMTKERLNSSINTFYLAYLNEALFSNSNNPISFGEIADFNVETISEKKIGADTEIDYIDISTIIEPKIIGKPKKYKFKDAPSRARRMAYSGDILISTVRPNLKAFAIIQDGNYVVSTGFAVATVREKVWGAILFHALFSDKFNTYCENNVMGTNYPAISVEALKKFTLSIPYNLEPEHIEVKLKAIEKSMEIVRFNKIKSKCVLQNLINYYFGGTN